MRIVAQRVSRAQVSVDGDIIGKIERGFMLLVGITHDDNESCVGFLAAKVANLRVFDDAAGDMNRSLLDLLVEGTEPVGVLVVSQFTLYADSRKGRRPSFINAAHPAHAAPLIESFVAKLTALGLHVEQGRFGAEMAVELVNDGPVTIILDSADLRP
jgi:D-tyrosyl-tRNA(Tyr) deacylase